MKDEIEYLPVTIDKGHIITIGERLYEQSIELVRELVNNAYDADATRVEVTVAPNEITVVDDGEGMDFDGLKQYFNVGSDMKLQNPISPKFGRNRIGQFGIGKFASLAAASSFELITQKGDFAARVVFNKERWMAEGDSWKIPLNTLKPDPKRGDGTTVRLIELKKPFKPEHVMEKIAEGVPIRAKNFSVFVNGYRVIAKTYSGNRIPVLHGTKYGIIHGEIVILPAYRASKDDMGIEVKVKGVTVRRELFDMTSWGKAPTRIRGEVNADFLPLTSDRSGFIEDSPEYESFAKAMEQTMAKVKQAYNQLASVHENRKASRALKEALERVHRALLLNPEFSPFGVVPVAGPQKEGIGEAAVEAPENQVKNGEVNLEELQMEAQSAEEESDSNAAAKEALERKRKPSLRIATPNAVVRRLKFGEAGVTCCLDHLGEQGPECMTEGTIIYINRDHPLYKRESKKKEAHILNIARLITQEISMMKSPENPRDAYNRQSRLLRDAFRDNNGSSR
ncbi:MAG: ATP-binding protein [Deltaproteobacteria bacterium]|nr:ATP-binding protein [Deltaproteobacteria bacterium]MBW1979297.1 ATP-binding protein [Deltaproteobacteria bacterium]MBW2046780.1 ATP-binding protein [Deltaproteobacteria bacterium]MBW2299510.1 ATP-binding protein [Deltaproteobacteria bacterium]